jgi:hypothetical protein
MVLPVLRGHETMRKHDCRTLGMCLGYKWVVGRLQQGLQRLCAGAVLILNDLMTLESN